ncbi:hypothetical protein LSS_06360 [Leptospira santarosai serovar Shermani str. LT 821]|uniref:Uncharacterized protein n=1 Tax=Leptospira santarosai serovar Shermani str. LT 821 TaxID=758847 RepID=K8YB70_9LEPT|nr:hypothetical protein LSS_06360 [Leptospira santarosai serovar Shermani str. LT 821]
MLFWISLVKSRGSFCKFLFIRILIPFVCFNESFIF